VASEQTVVEQHDLECGGGYGGTPGKRPAEGNFVDTGKGDWNYMTVSI